MGDEKTTTGRDRAEYYRLWRTRNIEKKRRMDADYYQIHRAEMNEKMAGYRERNRDSIRDKDRRRKRWFARWLNLLKRTQGCLDCGTQLGRLEYHHVSTVDRRESVSHMANMSMEAFFDEVAKCVVLCSQCHARRHVLLRRENG